MLNSSFCFRNVLGLKSAEDWIFNLNIGNVMFLTPMDIKELEYPIERYHELNRDAMLEKIVLICCCYFCIATELRFLSADEDYSQLSELFTKQHSDMWHAQGAYISAYFLPNDWPLVDHFWTSYEKYHIKQRADERQFWTDLDQERSSTSSKNKLMFKKAKGKNHSRNCHEMLKKSKSGCYDKSAVTTLQKSRSFKLLNSPYEKSLKIKPNKQNL